MGFIIMCFQSRALTVGITKKGAISSSRTKDRPGNGASVNSASATPSSTVMMITLQQVVADEREVNRHHQRHDHPQQQRDHRRYQQQAGKQTVHGEVSFRTG